MANEKRLIDANAVLAKQFTSGLSDASGNYYGHADVIFADDIENAPTVDAVEVVHGRWEWYTDRCEDLFLGCDDDYGWRCSKCKVPLDDEDDPEVMPTFRYCPNCGAKMDGDGNG